MDNNKKRYCWNSDVQLASELAVLLGGSERDVDPTAGRFEDATEFGGCYGVTLEEAEARMEALLGASEVNGFGETWWPEVDSGTYRVTLRAHDDYEEGTWVGGSVERR